jgi:hypothetical protein
VERDVWEFNHATIGDEKVNQVIEDQSTGFVIKRGAATARILDRVSARKKWGTKKDNQIFF